MQRRVLLSALAGGAAGMMAGPAAAQYPDRPVRLIVPFPPGGPTDVFARVLAERLGARWGKPVVVENRAGAGTVVGTNAVAKAPPDGYTLGCVISAFTINPAMNPALPYNTLADLAPVSRVAAQPLVLVCHPALQVKDLAELVALSKREADGLAFATPGAGTLTHLAGEMIARATGAKLVHIPYPGSAPALTDVLQGRVPLMFDIWNSVRPSVETGKLRVLGLGSRTQVEGAPPMEPIASIVPGFDITSFFGLVAPGGTPPAIVQGIAGDVRAVMGGPDMTRRLIEFGMQLIASTPEEFGAFIRTDVERWQRVVREAGIEVVR
ncbi:tripartite tricarboxylate transporter substrate binding protein [Pararoseomonas sp. SCSIO 73927]|uniref:tripartite tricarboxylate transporter substrate binding protein n=1 Tax=Pararoseomonas sp. SCSIO 73927 TaxID=3114537 RepID=UPI0030D1D9E1